MLYMLLRRRLAVSFTDVAAVTSLALCNNINLQIYNQLVH